MIMRAYSWSGLFLLTLPATSQPADEPLPRVEVAKRGKASTALVRAADRSATGTAFCVHSSGLFLTTDHVAQGRVTLVLDPGLKTEKAHEATLVRRDAEADLALLRVDGVKGLAALPLGVEDGLTELAEVVAVGFPFGQDLAAGRNESPAASVNAGSITSLRNKDGRLHRIQLDVTLNPGNSGGPVLDLHGKVVGVVVSGVRGTGVNFAIPAGTLAKFVGRPDVRFEPPVLTPANAHKPTTFAARVVPVLPPDPPLAVDLVLTPAGGKAQTHRMTAAGEEYRVAAVPLPPPVGLPTVRLAIQFSDGHLNGTTADRAFKVGDQEVRLADVYAVRLGAARRIVLADGKVAEGPVSGLGEVAVRVGGRDVTVDLAAATSIRASLAVPTDQVDYALIVRQGDREVHQATGRLLARGFLSAAPAEPDLGGIRPPLLEGDQVTRALPARVTDLVVGGGGRYLVLRLAGERRLAVFDVNAADVVGHIPFPEDKALFAAGLEEVVVLLPEARTIERWGLRTRERAAAEPIPVDGVIKAVALGSASKGPLLVHWATGTDPLAKAPYTLVDLGTLQVTEVDVKAPTMTSTGRLRDRVHLRASANGRVFGVWKSGSVPSGYGTIVVGAGGSDSYYSHASLGHVVPGPDGKVVFTAGGQQPPRVGRYERLSRGDSEVPACHGDQYLTLPPIGKPGKVAISVVGQARPVATVPGLDLVVLDDKNIEHDFTFDKRVHLIPDARLVITIPPPADRLVLYRLGE